MTEGMKVMMIGDFLTEKETAEAVRLYKAESKGFARKLANLIIEPNIGRINEAVGMEMHPMYLAYVVENALYKLTKAKK